MKKQDYDKLNQEFYQIAKNIFGDKFSEYDPFVQQKINELYQKDENGDFIEHSSDKWKQFIDDANGKNELLSKVLQMAIAMHPKLTNVVADNLLNLSVLHIATVIKLCEREDLNTFIHKKAYNKISLSARHHFESTVFDMINQTTTLSKDICNELLIDTIVALKDGRFFISDIERNILAVTDDDKKIKSLLDEVTDLPEHILSLIVNNKNLTESVRNKAFDMGCNWELISNYTRHIAQEMYPNIIIHPFNDIDSLHIKDEAEKKKLKQFSKMTLCCLIEQGMLSDEHKQDLLNRIRFENPEMMSSIGDIFCTECMYENDMEMLGRIVSMLEFDIKWPRGYESILLSNDFFCDSTDYHKITTFYVNSYICEKGIVDRAIRDNLDECIMKQGINYDLQCRIIKNFIQYINDNEQDAKNGNRLQQVKTEYFNRTLATTLMSPYSDYRALNLVMAQNPKANIMLLSNLAKASVLYGDKEYEQKENTFRIIEYNYEKDEFRIRLEPDADYDMLLSVLKFAKDLSSNHKSQNTKEIKRMISVVKSFKKEVQKRRVIKEREKLKAEISEMAKKDIAHFYVNASELKNRYETISKQLNAIGINQGPKIAFSNKWNNVDEFNRDEEDYR